MEPRLSIVCFYSVENNLQEPSEAQKSTDVSPTTIYPQINANTLSTSFNPRERSIDHGSPSAATSPAEHATYFPDEKILITESNDKQCVQEQQVPATAPPVPLPPRYCKPEVQARPKSEQKPFWKRHLYWILGIITLLMILISVIAVVLARLKPSDTKPIEAIRNNTRNSVASTGLTLLDNKTWNMHVFSQNSTGQIALQVSLDGKTFEPPTNVSLTIPPRVGSPISATAEQDSQTHVIMLNLFYISGINNVTMSALTCAEGSAKCGTINNCLLPTAIPVSHETGLAAVNVNNSQDWRVYYHDQSGFISQLQGNASGFNLGSRIGGEGLNGSDITAVNIDSTTNNIHVFYTDMLTQALFTLQYQKHWTTPRPVSNARVANWNPYSGFGSAYRPFSDQLHVYYTGLDKGIYEFVLNGTDATDTSFQPQPDGTRPWGEADYVGADITAVGWKDQIRFFQPARGRLVMGELNDTTWGEVFVDMITTGSQIMA
ncbi:BgTH12-07075 [Blumeria graminis f. sp. triticale]|nr:BgTH12-07075 [Blumeria graminis f. sp. triticale]